MKTTRLFRETPPGSDMKHKLGVDIDELKFFRQSFHYQRSLYVVNVALGLLITKFRIAADDLRLHSVSLCLLEYDLRF